MSALPGLEGITVSRWINDTLTADATLRGLLGAATADDVNLWEGVAPDDATGTWITYTILEPQDLVVPGMVHIKSRVEFQIKVTREGTTYAPLVPIYQRVHELLSGQANQEVPEGGVVMTCHRVSGLQFPEKAGARHYRNLGGLFRTETH